MMGGKLLAPPSSYVRSLVQIPVTAGQDSLNRYDLSAVLAETLERRFVVVKNFVERELVKQESGHHSYLVYAVALVVALEDVAVVHDSYAAVAVAALDSLVEGDSLETWTQSCGL